MKKTCKVEKNAVVTCVPVVGTTREEILTAIKKINKRKVAMIEWRVDYFEEVDDFNAVVSLLKEIAAINKKSLLFTYRTKAEGGHGKLNNTAEYLVLLKAVVLSKCIDYVDVELLLGDNMIETIKKHAILCDVEVIVSNHDFDSTPRLDSVVNRLYKMQEVGADIAKVAYTPKTKEDVKTLLEACKQAKDLSIPKVIIAMGELGKESRIKPMKFGSSIAYVTLGESSAPGQISLEEFEEANQQ